MRMREVLGGFLMLLVIGSTASVAAPPLAGPAHWCDTVPAKEIPVPAFRIPDGGRYFQAFEYNQALHLLYFKGDPKGGDVYYVRTHVQFNQPPNFSKPLRLNAKPGSVAVLNAWDAPRCDVGFEDRVHVVWKSADPQNPALEYVRVTDVGKNITVQTMSRDAKAGGASITTSGNRVQVCWHAPDAQPQGSRRVWVAESYNDGNKFQPPQAVSPAGVRVLERSSTCALKNYHLSPNFAYWSESPQGGADLHDLSQKFILGAYHDEVIHHARTPPGPGSSIDLANTHRGYLLTWDADGQIYVAKITRAAKRPEHIWSPAGQAADRRGPSICVYEPDTALVWSETSEDGATPILRWQTTTAPKNLVDRRGVFPLPAPDRHGVILHNAATRFMVLHD